MDRVQNLIQKESEKRAQQQLSLSIRNNANKYASGSLDPNTVDGLVNLGLQAGGRVGAVSQEIANPRKSLLQKVTSSAPGQFLGWSLKQLDNVNNVMAASILSMQGNGLTFGENIAKSLKEDTQVSTVLFGESKAKTKAGKVVSWVARTAFDTLIDPTTYITFGAGGARKITAGKDLAKSMLLKENAEVGLTKTGGKVLDYFNAVAGDVKGSKKLSKLSGELGEMGVTKEMLQTIEKRVGAGEDIVSVAKEVAGQTSSELSEYVAMASTKTGSKQAIELAKKELNMKGFTDEMITKELDKYIDDGIGLLDATTIQPDVARMSMTKLMEAAPHLRGELVGKGGINFFGQSILEGMKIRTVMNRIPGMTWLDEATEQTRLAVNGLFSNSVIRDGNTYKRMPKEYADFQRQLQKYKQQQGESFINKFNSSVKATGLKTADELGDAFNAYASKQEPADLRLQQVYRAMNELDGDGMLAINASGGTQGIQNFVTRPLTETKARSNWTELNNSPAFTNMSSNVTASNKKSRVTFEGVEDGSKKLFGDTADTADRAVTADGTNLRKTSAAKELASNPESAAKVAKGVDRIVKSLEDEIKWVESIGADNSRRQVHHWQQQINAVKNGELDNLYINDETGDVFFRRGATVEELTDTENYIEGFTVNKDEINWTESYFQAGIQRQQQLASKDFVNDISRFGVVEDLAPDGHRALEVQGKNFTDEVTGKPLMFEPSVAEGLELMIKSMGKTTGESNAFLESYDTITRLFKSSVTSIFPAFHARNGISNSLNNVMDIGAAALDPRKWQTSANIMMKQGKITKIYDDIAKLSVKEGGNAEGLAKLHGELYNTLKEPIFTDAKGITWTTGELLNTIKSKGIAFHAGVSDVGTDAVLSRKKMISETLTGKQDSLKNRILTVNPDANIMMQTGQKVGNTVENHARILNFISNLEKTGDVSHAAARTQMFLYDYSNLTRFEKDVMRRVVPFYSFQRRNIALQAELLTSTPGVPLAMTRAEKSFSDIMSDEDITDEEMESLPSYMKRGFYFAKKENGKIRTKMLAESITDVPVDFLSLNGIFGAMNPLLKVPIERATGQDLFRGKAIEEVTNATAFKFFPKPIKDFIGYTEYEAETSEGEKYKRYVSLKPSNLHLLNNIPVTSRLWSTMGQVSSDNKTASEKVLQVLTGISNQSIDADYSSKMEEKETLEQLERVLKDAGVIYQFNRNFVPK